MRNQLTQLMRCYHGAVAPTVALSLFGLIAVGGLAFDYAHVAAMDTELQNAADQAALAGATQLDGKTGAQSRAISAAQTLVNNLTYFANDGGGSAVTVPTITFYQDNAKAALATSDANAHFILVQVGARTANYALTPIVGALSSGPMSAQAFAGLGSAVCNVPPVMICNPDETATNKTFDPSAYVGDGIKLVANGSWAPGNFGYLDTGYANGASALSEALGWNTAPGDCIPVSGVTTKPGLNASVTGALNTRFDIYDANSCPGGGTCSASINSTKDLIRKGNGGNPNSCTAPPGVSGWQLPAVQYLATSATAPLSGTALTNLKVMGLPRDMCHAVSSTGSCANGPIGDGLWDRNAYFYVNYGATFDWRAAMTTAGYNPDAVTRYQVYKWEIANPTAGPDPRIVSGSGPTAMKSYRAPVCGAIVNQSPPSLTPGPTTPDRRRISVAIINCLAEGVNGSSPNLPVLKWVDLFLVQPSLNRNTTAASDVYVEVIGETNSAGDGTAGQVVRHDTPYLVE